VIEEFTIEKKSLSLEHGLRMEVVEGKVCGFLISRGV
jgi:hypothetical protein